MVDEVDPLSDDEESEEDELSDGEVDPLSDDDEVFEVEDVPPEDDERLSVL